LCKSNNINAVLVSLDAKKAFDSVDHAYIKETLKAYGFGPSFIRVFETLYNKISARILINGFTSEVINIERGVKQGDALSCAIFIICIDPLIRNLNENNSIREIRIINKSGKEEKIKFKGAAYADDISVICSNDYISIQKIFEEYERLTKKSGLELNADKTEILKLNNAHTEEFTIKYNGTEFQIKSVNKIKICGLNFCTSDEAEQQLNVKEKIDKLQSKIKLWSHRHLTMEGKVLIVKTFGLSQLIYNMQSYLFRSEDLTRVEKIIFGFLWSTSDNPNGIDRIKRSIMKNDFQKGGMKATDVECLDRSLKLRQFIRTSKTKHVISNIQNLLINNNVNDSYIKQEYDKISEKDPICKSAQESLNLIIDSNRESYKALSPEEYETNRNLINEVSSINLATYLKRKNRVFMTCLLKPLTEYGIITLGDLVQSMEHVKDAKLNKIMKTIISSIPSHLVNITKCCNEDLNSGSEEINYILIGPEMRREIGSITVKELQVTLKTCLKRIEVLDVKNKLGINNYDDENITRLRMHVKNSKLRNIYFRLIHKDFFTGERMKKYKMTNNDECVRCGLKETTEHLLWECNDSRNIWNIYNNSLHKYTNEVVTVNKYEDIFYMGKSSNICLIKIKLIQELIQILRPRNWTDETLTNLINKLIETDKYNARRERRMNKFELKWNS